MSETQTSSETVAVDQKARLRENVTYIFKRAVLPGVAIGATAIVVMSIINRRNETKNQ